MLDWVHDNNLNNHAHSNGTYAEISNSSQDLFNKRTTVSNIDQINDYQDICIQILSNNQTSKDIRYKMAQPIFSSPKLKSI